MSEVKQARELTERMNRTGINKRMEICPACGLEGAYYDQVEASYNDAEDSEDISRWAFCNNCESTWTIHYIWGRISGLELSKKLLEENKVMDKGVDKGLEIAEQKGLTKQTDIDEEVQDAIDKEMVSAGLRDECLTGSN